MSGISSLSDIELRNKLLEYGFDLPVSLNRGFLLKKLEKIVKEQEKKGQAARLPLSPLPEAPTARNSGRQAPPANATGRNSGRQAPPANATGRNSGRQDPPTPTTGRNSGRQAPLAPPSPSAAATGRQAPSTLTSRTGRTTRSSMSTAQNNQQVHQAVQVEKEKIEVTAACANMFAIIVSGRLVQSNFVQSPTERNKFGVDVSDADGINHIVVFLTGSQPFPPGAGGQIYFGWTDLSSQEQIRWHLLGHISNEKPSAIFKISDLEKALELYETKPPLQRKRARQSVWRNAQIGISVEPLEIISQTTPTFVTEV